MTMDLKRGDQQLDFSTIGWAFYLSFAQRYGWKGEDTMVLVSKMGPVIPVRLPA